MTGVSENLCSRRAIEIIEVKRVPSGNTQPKPALLLESALEDTNAR